jgi:hypothetical protein
VTPAELIEEARAPLDGVHHDVRDRRLIAALADALEHFVSPGEEEVERMCWTFYERMTDALEAKYGPGHTRGAYEKLAASDPEFRTATHSAFRSSLSALGGGEGDHGA